MRRDEAYFLDMLLAARDATSFIGGLTRELFENNRMCQLAVLKSLETIGEAAGQISKESREAHPEIPWHELIGLLHRLVHVYFTVNLMKVWDMVQNDLPGLISALEPLVPEEPSNE